MTSFPQENENPSKSFQTDNKAIDAESFQKYTALIAHMQQGFCVIEVLFDEKLDYRFLEVNSFFEKQTGLVNAVGKTMRQLQPAHEQYWFDTYANVARTNNAIHFEQEAAHLMGGVWYDVFAFPFGPVGSNQVAILFNDITDRKQAEQQQVFLLRLSDSLRAWSDEPSIKNQTVDILAQHLGTDRFWIAEVSVQQDIANVGPENIRSRDFVPMTGVYQLADYPGIMRQLMTQPIAVEDVANDPRFEESEKNLLAGLSIRSLLVTPLRKGEREVIWALVATTAVPRRWRDSERVLLEDVAERTWAAVERAKAEEALREEYRRKDDFMAMLGHELRNPLAMITNTLVYLDLTQGKDPEMPYAKGIGQMNRHAKHLGRMVNDLLDISRIRQGKIRIQRQQLDLNELLALTVDAAQLLFQESNRSLIAQLPETTIYVNGDAARLSQTLMNLLTNGAKYTDEGGHVWVTLGQENNHAIIRVKDDGMGIAPDELKPIFETFVQGDTSLDRPHGGLGLGLAVVKQIVEGHEGQIEAYSAGSGQGSEFVVELPILTEISPPEPVEIPKRRTASESLQVLLVDDNHELADMTAKILRLLGYGVHVSYNGVDGIAAAKSLMPDAVLLDIGMPYLDGYAVCKRLRKESWGKTLPIIALTGLGREADKQRSWAAGFDGHLLKPIDYIALAESLTKIIGKKKI